MATTIQRNFAGGEISPVFYGRVDSARYQAGLRKCRNSVVMRQGGTRNRAGAKYVCEIKDSTKKARLIQFVYSSSEVYMLEFGDRYMRVARNGQQVREASLNISTISTASLAEVQTAVDHGYSTGDEVYLAGIKGMTALNRRNFKIVVTDSDKFTIKYMDGTDVDSTLLPAYVSDGTVGRVYEIVTPYLEAELPDLYYGQASKPNVITLTHNLHATAELTYHSATDWTLDDIVIGSIVPAPTGLTAAGDPMIGSFDGLILACSNPSFIGGHIIGTTAPTVPVVGAWGGSALVTDATIAVTGVVAADGTYSGTFSGTINNSTTIDSVSGTFVGARYLRPNSEFQVTAVDAITHEESNVASVISVRGTGAYPITLNWNAVTGAGQYNIYALIPASSPAAYGFIGFTVLGVVTFADTGTAPDTINTAPVLRNPFLGAGNFPAINAIYQSRRFFANSINDPQTVWGSQTGRFQNFNVSTPLQDDDAVTFTLRGRSVNRVRHLLDFRLFLLLSETGEFAEDSDVITPSTISLKQHTYNGASALRPIAVVDRALFVQARGQLVRDFGFEWESQGFRGEDLSAVADHLFAGHSLVDWAYQQVPNSIVWAVREDGVMLGLTYVREHEVMGWHQHDTDGKFESVATAPEGSEDALYCIVNRTIDGRTVRYIERFETREISDIRDSVFMDCGLTYDGRNTGSETVTISGGTTWLNTETLTLTASTAMFTTDDTGKKIFIYDGTSVIHFKLETYVDATSFTGRADKTIPVSLRAVPTGSWALAIQTMDGLWPLEGKSISAFGDGKVVCSPNNDAFAAKNRTVTDGQVTFGSVLVPEWYAVIQVGLPYTSDLETLDIDSVSGETLAGKRIAIGKLTVQVEKTRGFFAGPAEPTGTEPLENLNETKVRNEEDYDSPVDMLTGKLEIDIQAHWTKGGRVFIRQVDPVPVSILAIAPDGLIPLRG